MVSDPASPRFPGSLRQTLPCCCCGWRCHVCVWWHRGQQCAEWRDVPIPGVLRCFLPYCYLYVFFSCAIFYVWKDLAIYLSLYLCERILYSYLFILVLIKSDATPHIWEMASCKKKKTQIEGITVIYLTVALFCYFSCHLYLPTVSHYLSLRMSGIIVKHPLSG